jgi:hypothetical protein
MRTIGGRAGAALYRGDGDPLLDLLHRLLRPRNVRVARATAEILNRAGVSWGLPGRTPNAAGRAFARWAIWTSSSGSRKTTGGSSGLGAGRILTVSPHCLATFRKEYGIDAEVLHFSQYLVELLTWGDHLKKDLGGVKVTYHDPCYWVGTAASTTPPAGPQGHPGVELVEMDRIREHEPLLRRRWRRALDGAGQGGGLSDLRVEEALAPAPRSSPPPAPTASPCWRTACAPECGDRIQVKDSRNWFARASRGAATRRVWRPTPVPRD